MHSEAEGGVEGQLDVIDCGLGGGAGLVEAFVDAKGAREGDGRKGLHVRGEVFLDERDGEGVAVEDLLRVSFACFWED